MFACERDRQRECVYVLVRERAIDRERERESVCVCMCHRLVICWLEACQDTSSVGRFMCSVKETL